jgi:hypothetical protein
MPLRELAAVELRARLQPGTTPMDTGDLVKEGIQVPLRGPPQITLEEVNGYEGGCPHRRDPVEFAPTVRDWPASAEGDLGAGRGPGPVTWVRDL